ncbi:hypothetical protein TELCIR_19312, partial [Teladorsagia circumcincta]
MGQTFDNLVLEDFLIPDRVAQQLFSPSAFVTLKFHLPSLRAHTKRVSKLKILNAAISYIDSLVAILKNYDANVAAITLPSERRHRTAQ